MATSARRLTLRGFQGSERIGLDLIEDLMAVDGVF